MDFQAQVEALTGIDGIVEAGITTNQLTQFLTDGVIDVTERCIYFKPEEKSVFSRVTAESSTNGALGGGIKDILSVVREAGVENDWRGCRELPIDLQSRVTDSSSIHYASKYNPVFIKANDGSIFVYPPATSTTPQNTYKIYYVNTTPVNRSDVTLAHSHSTINYFPKNKYYLVMLYASIKCLDHIVDSVHSMPENLSNIVLSIPTLPTPPTLSAQSISFTQKAPMYVQPLVEPNFSDANNWINTEEDSEMLTARVQEINAELQEYQANIQNNLNKFNEENAEYQIEFQKASQNAQLTSKDEDQAIQKYQTELSAYSAEVNREVQEINKLATDIQKYTAEMQKSKMDVDIYQQRSIKFQQQYDAAFQVMAGTSQGQQRQRRK
tara:strand:+ start:1384 stop:2529 length:1146 start_codon:yes stop_codon:yes gene_type:complete